MQSRLILPAFAALSVPAAAQVQKLTAQTAVTFFIEAQDVPAFTPEEMAARARTLGDEPEAAAADAALNQWKLCVQESLLHWAPLGQSAGTLIDGAYGRCADIERDYRVHLMRMTPGGRQVVDVQFARNMTRTLEDGWRPRLVAATLEQALAKLAPPPAIPAPASREGSGRAREERSREEKAVPHP